GADLRAGRRVLLAHGTTPLIWNGSREVPLDRGNTILELLYGKRMDLTAKMTERFQTRYYDRIYAMGNWYIWNIPVIQQQYREVRRIARPEILRVWPPFPYRWGTTHVYEMMGEVVVYEPK
ncbi:MAG TPA: hypothetical protein VKU61_01240, partial [Candidatus Binatia bacterium]|nr:hypothetical protein [Candidatus Binatia bacterium]